MRKSPFKLRSLFLLSFCLLWPALPSPASAYARIVSLKPNITEILFALGVGPQVVGVTQFCKRPPEVKALPKVADYLQAFPEAILLLKPDLVLGTKENGSQKEIQFLLDRGLSVLTLGSSADSSSAEIQALKSRGIEVDGLGFATLDQTTRSIEAMGELLGRGEAAKEMTRRMRSELDTLKQKAASLPKIRVLYVVGYQPLVVAGGNNFFDEAGDYIGAENVAHQSRLKYPYYTTELLIRAAPEVVFDFAMGSEAEANARSQNGEFWKQFSSIPAVKNGRVYALDIEKMRAVPSLPETLKELFLLLHPKGN
ncbi:MAG: helical backbone metal receptor [Deltaproteobacteria bacterium]|nr:helical backbone metal receptor [Deltaproteobacteria bacterium]